MVDAICLIVPSSAVKVEYFGGLPMPGPLDARLLFAARAAYLIPPAAGAALVLPPAYGLSNVEACVGGRDNIDAAFIADTDEGLVLSFRGTFPPNSPDHAQTVLDWLNDGDAVFVPGEGLPGHLHQGFRNALNILWPLLEGPLLVRVRAAANTAPLYVTGHSKGGAIAFIAAMRCQSALAIAGLPNPVFVCTFAAARPGDQEFADGFDQVIPHAIRYEYADDIVPHLPPENVLRLLLQKIPSMSGIRLVDNGFISPGNLRYVVRGSTPATPPEGDSPLLSLQRIASIVTRAAKLDFETIVSDHSIGPQSGYATAITGGA
jgi:hypothetical protein